MRERRGEQQAARAREATRANEEATFVCLALALPFLPSSGPAGAGARGGSDAPHGAPERAGSTRVE